MKYTTIRIEGSVLSSDILDKIEQGDLGGQRPQDFLLDSTTKVKDEIARAWADAHDLWRIFCRQRERVGEKGTGTTETRKYWIIPLLGILGYDAEIARAEEINAKSYAISHRAVKREGFPIHIMGYNDSLDKKREDSGPRMSPHALVQEYINITEHLYAIVTNGILFRLLRDSSRLVKLSFIEFDLQSMMEEEHFADFAIMYRLIHASRMPVSQDTGAESLIEKYHQDALDSGSRIREGLSEAVENSIKSLAEGFLNHPDNTGLREAIEAGHLSHFDFYQYHLRLIYRLLFLMVIEERNLIYKKDTDLNKVRIYYDFYSISRLRLLCEKAHLTDRGYNDLWIGMKNTFRLFEKENYGHQLDIKPLGGELFSPDTIGILDQCNLDNSVLLECLRNLSFFTNKNNNQKMRVNYASLNVEEFGAVYEGLLEYDPLVERQNNRWRFIFVKGIGRSSSGSHYTPDELVQPLIKHSLEYIIEDKLKEAATIQGFTTSKDNENPLSLRERDRVRVGLSLDVTNKEKALLSIKVCDVACGSGHILLNAARRIAVELARIRTGEDQPSPPAFREAVRDVIQHCIYGVDKNPLAVELCKVALWLEAHNSGEPLHFLDHHIKCGDAIVGLGHIEELQKGIAEEACKRLPGDDKDVCASLRKINKAERNNQLSLDFEGTVTGQIKDIAGLFKRFSDLPERTPEEIEEKRKAYLKLTSGGDWFRLKTLSDIQVAQFFIPKDKENQTKIITDGTYRQYMAGIKQPLPQAIATVVAVASEKKFFHWFLEFPEVFAPLYSSPSQGEAERGGFDCILGNPPYLGGSKISGFFGNRYLNFIKEYYHPAEGLTDLIAYFFRRIFSVIAPNSFFALITTNSVYQGDSRQASLDQIYMQDGIINFAIRSVKWPGQAKIIVSLLSVVKGNYLTKKYIDGIRVDYISQYLDSQISTKPFPLVANKNSCFIGSSFLGKGFVINKSEYEALKAGDINNEILFPTYNGDDLNNLPEITPNSYVIYFSDWDFERVMKFENIANFLKQKVLPERLESKQKQYVDTWWRFKRPTVELYKAISGLKRHLVTSLTTRYLNFSYNSSFSIYSHAVGVVSSDKFWIYSILQSTFHSEWAAKEGSSLANTIRYTPSDCFETFPFPPNLTPEQEAKLEAIGEKYHEHRRQAMLYLQIGLTKTYNLFHKNDLSFSDIEKVSKVRGSSHPSPLPSPARGEGIRNMSVDKGEGEASPRSEKGYHDIIKLRELHVQMDNDVLSAYGWTDMNLTHDFYEVDYLPENDRIRFTISPNARKEILKRLLDLNHKIHEEEVKTGLWEKKKAKKIITDSNNNAPSLFD